MKDSTESTDDGQPGYPDARKRRLKTSNKFAEKFNAKNCYNKTWKCSPLFLNQVKQ